MNIISEISLEQILDKLIEIQDSQEVLKSEFYSVKADITEAIENQQKTNTRLANLQSALDTNMKETDKFSEYHTKTLSHLRQLQTDLEFTYQKTALHDLKFNRIETLLREMNKANTK